ncbi:MAG: AMP-binding protein, partial [bacterium]|nr:AMP-binding protein [bacterium]
ELPFEQLLDDLRPERELSYSPLFQVMLVFQNTPAPAIELAGLEVVRLDYEGVVVANSDWGLWLWEEAGGIGGFVEYNTDLYDTVTLLRVTDQFRTLLEAAVGHPGRRISQLPVLSPAARHQLFAEWNDVGAPPPEPKSFHQLFEAWAERLPEAIALVSDEGQLTYRELNARANRLGRRLRRLGVGPEISVGIFLEYSPEVVVAALAVMKSGGVFLPLDAIHARRRIGQLLEGAGAGVLLTRESLLSELPAELAAGVVRLDSEWEEIARESAGNLPNPARGANLVYLVYTSGTTGRPKAVMISHAGLMNIFHGYRLAYSLDAGMVHLQMASFSFDVFTGDLMRALGAGGKLVMCPRDVLLTPEHLYALIRREQVNCAEFVPAVVRELMSYLDETGQTLAFMRLVIVGSDIWHLAEHETLKRWCGPGTRLINSYGVAEATIDNTYFEHAAVTLGDEGSAPIGRQFGSNRITLLDRALRPVPAGGAGELCVGGSTLARGYLGRP